MTEDVDAVYTWVDGSDPGFQAMRRQDAGSAADGQVNRYRSNGELRFSLASLLRRAPWERRRWNGPGKHQTFSPDSPSQ
jgi:hypothetical protein